MLLWVTVLAVAGAAVALFERRLRSRHLLATLAAQAAIGLGFYAFLLFASNPFERLDPGAGRGQRAQPAAPGPGPRLPSADPLFRLCRHLDRFLLRGRRAGHARCRPGLRAGDAALGARRLDLPHARHHRRLLLGLLRARLGRLVVLGSGRERLADAVAGGDRLAPFGDACSRPATALRAWTVMLAVVAFSMSMVGTFLVRSGILTSVHAFAVDPRRGTFILVLLAIYIGGALTLFAPAGRHGEGGLDLRAGQPRRRAGRQQSAAVGGARHRPDRHALSAGRSRRCGEKRLGRPALFQPRRRAARAAAGRRHGGGAAAALAARPAAGAGGRGWRCRSLLAARGLARCSCCSRRASASCRSSA